MRTPLLLVAALLLLVSGCGDGGSPTPENPTTGSPEASMNIDEAKVHYPEVIREIRSAVRCGEKPLTWREQEPGRVDGVETDDNGDFTAYVYRGAMLTADEVCHGQDFKDALATITRILRDHGGIKDDVVLNDTDDYAEGGYVKWQDHFDATYSFGSEKSTVLSVTSGTLDQP